MMRILFFGTPAFAVAILQALLRSPHSVVGIVTQPDRPMGRGLRLREEVSPPGGGTALTVKEAARDLKSPILQPTDLAEYDFLEKVRSLKPELAVVVSYGRLLPPSLLQLFPRGAINLHASLLPKLRGAAPIQWALIRGETETGVTIFHIDERLDHGPILLQQRHPIGPEETAQTLEGALSRLGAQALLKAVDQIEGGQTHSQPQEDALADYAPRLTKEDGWIDWSRGCQEIHNRIRGVQPWPGAMIRWEGRLLKIMASHPDPNRHDSKAPPGTVVLADPKQGLWVQTGGGQLRIDRLQLEGGKEMASADFLRGHPILPGARMGPAPPVP